MECDICCRPPHCDNECRCICCRWDDMELHLTCVRGPVSAACCCFPAERGGRAFELLMRPAV
jgi:hypothetical protein